MQLAAVAGLSGAAAQSTAFISKGLVVNLVASSFDNATFRWDNLATPGAFNNFTNGDFVWWPGTAGNPYLRNMNGVMGVALPWGGNGRMQVRRPAVTGTYCERLQVEEAQA